MVISLLAVPVSALEGQTGGLSWSLSGGTLTVSGKGDMPDYTDAFMPPWYDMANAVTRIVVNDGVTGVGSLAFYGCKRASFVKLPDSVTYIGDRAFKDCSSLSYLRFPDGLTSIGDATFEFCEKLNGITLPSSLVHIGNYAFDRCTSLSHITIPESVNELGMVVFAYCTSLTSAVVRCPVSKLPDGIFYGCASLSSVYLPETVDAVGDLAFHSCENLSSVYYSGESGDIIGDFLKSDSTTVGATVTDSEYFDSGNSTSGSFFDDDTATGTSTAVTNTDNSTITKKNETTYTYTVNGESATLDEVLNSGEDDEVTTEGKSQTTVSAVIKNEDGWSELVDTVKNTLKNSDNDENLQVDVTLTGSEVSGKDIAALAGQDVTLSITTDSGCTWIINEKDHKSSDFSDKNINLDYTVTKLEKNKTKIDGETVYKLNFDGTTSFGATVGINLMTDDAYKYATLYKKKLFGYEEIKTVVVDENGVAWFSLPETNKGDYYIGINVDDADKSNAEVPQSLHGSYGINDTSTLMGMDGNMYEITGRTSKWGISGAQFALYAAIVIGVVVLIVTLIMVTLNKISKSKAKYALPAQDQSAEVDPEALRLQLMKEMLEEANKKNGKDDKKQKKGKNNQKQ